MTDKIFLLRIYILLILSALMSIASCASRNSLIVGSLPKKTACVAVMPFVTKGDIARSGSEFLPEFLASDLFKEGFTGLIYPREISKVYEDSRVTFPKETDKKYALDLGKALGSDSTIWGDITSRTVIENAGSEERKISIVSVEAFHVNTKNGDVNWYYDSKKIVPSENYIKALSEISSEMAWGLLRLINKEKKDFQGGCMRGGLAERLKGFVVSLRPQMEKPSVPVVREETKAEMLPEKASVRLTDAERKIYESLIGGEKIVLGGLKFDGRTSNVSKEGILYLSSLGKIFQIIGAGYKFRFESHIDSTGDIAADINLSLARVKSVKVFLTKYFNLGGEIIEIKALGGQVPLLPNINKRSRERNMRIELSALKISE